MSHPFYKKIILLLSLAFTSGNLVAQTDGSDDEGRERAMRAEERELEDLSTLLSQAKHLKAEGIGEWTAGVGIAGSAGVYGFFTASEGLLGVIKKIFLRGGVTLNWKKGLKRAVLTAGSLGVGYVLKKNGEYTIVLSDILIRALEKKIAQRVDEIETELDAIIIIRGE